MHSGEGLQSQSMMIKVDSMDKPGGKQWDSKGESEIVKIYISHSPASQKINSIQFLHVVNQVSVLSQKHGKSIGNMFNTVKLDYPSEFITWISGDNGVGADPGWRFLRSLTIGTNKGLYGPFGCLKVQHNFKIEMGEDDAFGGFHGSFVNDEIDDEDSFADLYEPIVPWIESIGVYVKPFSSQSNLDSASEIKKEKY